jgi:hypothetical protein
VWKRRIKFQPDVYNYINFLSVQGNMKQHMLTHKIRDMPSHLFETSKPPPPPVNTSNNDEGSNTEEVRTSSSLESPLKPDLGVKRSPPEGEAVLPIPKRQPGMMQMWFICMPYVTTVYFPANR